MKKLLLVCLTIAIITAALTAFFVLPASGETYSSTCGAEGDNLTWTFDTVTGTLTISGTGKMGNYSSSSSAPWSSYQYSIKTVVIGNGVTSIGNYAFSECSSLRSITIPDSVTSIGESAFSCCNHLTSITIPSSVTSIGKSAFGDCSSLTSIAIPDSVTSIGSYAFYNCRSLTSITVGEGNPVYHSEGNCLIETANKIMIAGFKNSVIPANGSVTSIGDYAFYYCSNLTSIAIPDSVTSIGDDAFCGCSSLTSITVEEGNSVYHSAGDCLIETASKTLITGCQNSVIPTDGSVTSIGDYAFYYCSSLTSITIPDSVTSIGGSAFYGCWMLTSLTIPEGATRIGDSAFYACSSLKSLMIPENVTSIGNMAFYRCYSLKTVYNCSSLDLVKGSTDHGYVAYYADNVYLHQYMTPADGECVMKEPATCTTSAIYYYGNCVFCDAVGEGTFEYGEPLGHTPGEVATCTTAQFCAVCHLTLSKALGHDKQLIGGAIPTCAQEGSTVGYICRRCDEVLEPSTAIPKTKHIPRGDATCLEPQVCNVCEAILSEALGHNVATSAGKPPTCLDSGLTGREQCTVCEVVLVAEEVVAPLGHAFDLISDEGTQCSRCSVFMPREGGGLAAAPVVIAAAGVAVLLVILAIIVASAKRTKQKKALARAAESEVWESKTRR